MKTVTALWARMALDDALACLVAHNPLWSAYLATSHIPEARGWWRRIVARDGEALR